MYSRKLHFRTQTQLSLEGQAVMHGNVLLRNETYGIRTWEIWYATKLSALNVQHTIPGASVAKLVR